MYKYDPNRDLKLATNAWPINQNLTLLDVQENGLADKLAVIHEGFVNVIPVLEPNRRSKYIPLHRGNDRGKGEISQVKWLNVNGEMVFIILSDAGLQVYNEDITDMKYFHCCRDGGEYASYTIGVCVLQSNILCVGTNLGLIWIFQAIEDNSNFKLLDRLCAHEKPILFLEGLHDVMVSTSKEDTYVWKIKNKCFGILQKVYVPGLLSYPTAARLSNFLLIAAYKSGELCIFDMLEESKVIRSVAHKLKITCLDFSCLKNLILTGSVDMYVKIWHYNKITDEINQVQSIFNTAGPLCGVAFLNFACTEFCVTTAGITDIKICYIQEQKEQILF